jgi:hypothetical protein
MQLSVLAPTDRIFALRAWALVHGLAVLVLDKRLPPDLETIDAVIKAHDTALMQVRASNEK